MSKIITYRGTDDALVWLKERKDMDADTELVVPFAHEVIFVKNGKMVNSFTMGKYNLSECAVGEGKLFESLAQKVDCRIYFVKKEGGYNIKFAAGVLSIVDPVAGADVDLDLSGAFSIKIIDSKVFLAKLLAYTQKASLSEVKNFFRGRMLVYIKDHLMAAMDESGTKAAELNSRLMPVSKHLELSMRYAFENYGVSIEGFMLQNACMLSCNGEVCQQPAPIKAARKACGCKEKPTQGQANKEESKKEVKGETMYCPACGVDIPPLSVFCNKCGKKID